MKGIREPSFYMEPEEAELDVLHGGGRHNNLCFSGGECGFPLRQSSFYECRFDHTVLRTDLSECLFADVVFSHCDFSGAVLTKTEFRRVRFENCRMGGADFSKAVFRDTAVINCQCRYINFSSSVWRDSGFDSSLFDEEYFSDIRFEGMAVQKCSFAQTEWLHTPMAGLDMSDSVIDGISVTPQDLRGLTVNESQAVACVGLLGLNVK